MLQLLYLDVSKLNQGVTHEMRVGRGWRCGRRPRRRGPAAGALAHRPDVIGRSLARCEGTVRTLVPWIGRPSTSKSGFLHTGHGCPPIIISNSKHVHIVDIQFGKVLK